MPRRLLDAAKAIFQPSAEARKRPHFRVKELPASARPRLLRHFLALGESDRILRFGGLLSDELVERHVARIDFERDIVFGVYSHRLRLLGVGHLAFAPREATPVASATIKATVAEFGVSVDASARGWGVGSALFRRAAIRCRNADVDTLTMHCLSSNKTMLHIATKAGMQIQRDFGEADAYLKIPPADAASLFQEAWAEQGAVLDYTFRRNARALLRWLGRNKGR